MATHGVSEGTLYTYKIYSFNITASVSPQNLEGANIVLEWHHFHPQVSSAMYFLAVSCSNKPA